MPVACDINSLRTASKCYDCLSSTEKQALKTHFLALALKAAGGTDYTNTNTLLSASACFACEPDFALESMELAIWKDLASNLGASIPTTINGQRALTKCAPCGATKARRAAAVFLLCQLNAKGF
jgi:hypothetical protein